MRSSLAMILAVMFTVSGCAMVTVESAAADPEVGLAGPGDLDSSRTGLARAERSIASPVPSGGFEPLPVTKIRPAPHDKDGGKGKDGGNGDAAAQDVPAPGEQGFTHPGVFLDQANLDEMRARVASGKEPWASQWQRLLDSKWGTLGYTPSPRQVVECGAHDNPDLGCTDERRDAHAAYAHALAWYVTEDERYAKGAIEIMNAWSATVTDHISTNAHLQAGWTGAIWPRAAEIIRYTYDGWPAGEVERFEDMLRRAYLPDVTVRDYANGNWELAMTEAAIAIAVFTDDQEVYDAARATFLDRSRAYVYLDSDGPIPTDATGSPYDRPSEIFTFWRNDTFGQGGTQETCRDLEHTTLGLSGMGHTLTTTLIQGDNLYGKVGARLAEALELHARISVTGEVPSWLCGGSVDGNLQYLPDSALNTLTKAYGCEMSWSLKHNRDNQLPHGSDELLTAWEPLTHGTTLSPPASAEVSYSVCPG